MKVCIITVLNIISPKTKTQNFRAGVRVSLGQFLPNVFHLKSYHVTEHRDTTVKQKNGGQRRKRRTNNRSTKAQC